MTVINSDLLIFIVYLWWKGKTKEVPKKEESRLRWDEHKNPMDIEEPPFRMSIAAWHSHAENPPHFTKEEHQPTTMHNRIAFS